MATTESSPQFILGGGSSGNSAGTGSLSELELDYQNLLSGAADIVSGSGVKTIIITSGALTTASSVASGTETASEIAANLVILQEIAQFCQANDIGVDVEADLTYAPTWPNGPDEGHNELVDQWAPVAASVGLPITGVEDVMEVATADQPSSFSSLATIEANAVRTLIEDYSGSTYDLTAANLAVGDMEGAPPSTAYLTEWWNAYDNAAAEIGVGGFSYATADTGWFAPWIESVPAWQAFLEGISGAAASENMTLDLDVITQGSEADLSTSQFIAQAEQNAASLATLEATGSVVVSNVSVLSWSALPVGIAMVTSPTSSSNEVVEIEATYPLYLAGSITAQGTMTFGAPSQFVLTVGKAETIMPLSVGWDAADVLAGNRLAVVIIDQTGTLSATPHGAGTVSSLASNILVLNGDSADLAAELSSVSLAEYDSGPDTIDVETFGATGRLSDIPINVFAAAAGQSSASIDATSNMQGWIASSALMNSGTVITGNSIVTSETLYWSTTGTLAGTITSTSSSDQSAFINTVPIHEPLAEYGIENASSVTLGTTADAVVDLFDPSVDWSPYAQGGYANNPGVNDVAFAPLPGWLGNSFDPAAAVTPITVQSTTNTFSPVTGQLETSVASLAPDPITVDYNTGAHPDTFAVAFNNGGSQVTTYNTGNNPLWDTAWDNQFSSVTSTYDDAGVLVERFFQGGAANPLFTIDDVFDPNTGQLWEEFQSTIPPAVKPGSTVYADTKNPFEPGFDTGPLYITQFNTGNNPNWDYVDWGSSISSDTEVWTDYFIMENFTGVVENFSTAYAGGLNAYPYEFVNGSALDLIDLPGTINVNLNALGMVTIDSQTMVSGLTGLSEIDAAGASGPVTITGLAGGGSTLIGGDNSSIINGFGGDTIIVGIGQTRINTGNGGSTIQLSSAESVVSVAGNHNLLTAAGGSITFIGSGNTLAASSVVASVISEGASLNVNGSADSIEVSAGGTLTLAGTSESVSATGVLIFLATGTTGAEVGGDDNEINAIAGSQVQVYGANDTVDGSNVALTLGSGTSVILNGSNDTINVIGSGTTITLAQYTADLAVTGSTEYGVTILDAMGDAINLSSATIDPVGTLHINATPPTVTAVTTAPATGDLSVGQLVTLIVSLSESVTVTDGVPTLQLNDGGTAYYTGGSGTSALTFSYMVTTGQYTADLAISGSALNGAKIKDATGYVANLTGLVNKPTGTLQVDTIAPVVSTVTASPATADLGLGQQVILTVSLSEAVTVSGGTPALQLNDGGMADYTGGSGTGALTFTYTVTAGQNIADLAVIGSALNGAKVADAAGAVANLAGVVTNPAGTLQIDTNPVTVTPGPGQVMLHAPASQYTVADDGGSLYIQDEASGGDGTQILSGVVEMVFTDGVGVLDPTGTAENVDRIYQATLNRSPDVAGLTYWTAEVDGSNVPLSAVADSFATSPEFIQDYGPLSNSGFVNQLYENVLGRPADAAGAQYWNGLLASGTSRGTVVLGFAESQEYDADTLATAGDVNNAGAYRLYQAALDRTPDATGLAYWSSMLANGTSETQVAQDFINSAEFQQDYGALSPSAFVSAMYQNVLHRGADPGGLQYWTNTLLQGASEASVLVGFSDSLENRLQTAGATHANWVFIPQ